MEPQIEPISDSDSIQKKRFVYLVLLAIIFLTVGVLFGLLSINSFNRPMKKEAKKVTPLPTAVVQKRSLAGQKAWQKKYIELYGMELELPAGWQLSEINRRKDDGDIPSLYGHDCADYQIKSDDSLIVINLYPVCSFAEGFPNAWPDDTVIVREKDENESYLVRFFDKEQSKFVYTFGSDDAIDEGGPVKKRAINLPAFFGIVTRQYNEYSPYSYFVGNDVAYSGPKDTQEEYLKIVDRIILSLKEYKNTVTILPTPTPVTANWQSWSDAAYGFNLKFPPQWTAQKEAPTGSEVEWVHFRKAGDDPDRVDHMTITVYPSWQRAGFENRKPSKTDFNFFVGTKAQIPAWIYYAPTKDQEKLGHYETRLYFEIHEKVFHVECFHDWDPQADEACNYIMSSIDI